MRLFSPQKIGWLAGHIAKSLRATLRIKRVRHPDFDPKKPCIYAFWHGDLFVPIMAVRVLFDHKVAGFVSTSKDGDILASLLDGFGYEVVRGSTSHRAIGGMVKLVRCARQGYSLGISPDGPRGPRHEVREGLMFLAKKTNLPIIPVGVHVDRFWQFHKAWDKFKLPKPFSRAVVYFDKPIYVTDDEAHDALVLKDKIGNAMDSAKRWFDGDAETLSVIKEIDLKSLIRATSTS